MKPSCRLIMALAFSATVLAPKTAIASEPSRGKIDFSMYGGKYTQTDFAYILFRQQTEYMESYLAVGALNYLLDTKIRALNFETEGQIVKHFGFMQHSEVNGVLIARWPGFLSLPLSIAFGEGLSLASKRPRLEELEKNIFLMRFNSQKTSPLLNYLMVELDFPLAELPHDPRLFFRIHHRSGVFGLYCPPTCGSNFITYGVKFSLDI